MPRCFDFIITFAEIQRIILSAGLDHQDFFLATELFRQKKSGEPRADNYKIIGRPIMVILIFYEHRREIPTKADAHHRGTRRVDWSSPATLDFRPALPPSDIADPKPYRQPRLHLPGASNPSPAHRPRR